MRMVDFIVPHRPTTLIVDLDLQILDRTVGTSWRTDQDVTGHHLFAAAEDAGEAAARGIQRAYFTGPEVSRHRDIHGWAWIVRASRDGRGRIRIEATPIDTPAIYQVRIHSAHGPPLLLLTTSHRSVARREARRLNAGKLAALGLSADVTKLH